MIIIGDTCEVVGGWIHGFEVGEIVTVTGFKEGKPEPGDDFTDIFVDCRSKSGLVQWVCPKDLKVLAGI